MKLPDLTPLLNNDAEYEKLCNTASDRFKCEWDDSVHDSYGRYLNAIQEYSRIVRSIRCKAESLVKEAEVLKLDELKRKADSLCREADSV